MFDREAYKKAWDKRRDEHNRKLIQRWKLTKGCAICGYKKHHVALQLDHIDPHTKHRIKGMNTALNYKWSKSRIKKELALCQVLCANCHTVRTYDEKHYHIRKELRG